MSKYNKLIIDSVIDELDQFEQIGSVQATKFVEERLNKDFPDFSISVTPSDSRSEIQIKVNSSCGVDISFTQALPKSP